ncbi:MAG: helix-turn-helix domain-containing protein [Bacteroides sp.]|nr:helix-turn-helix domain-containing protein [Eubacterium sp.]MCM1418332.1 helix-turn-helix domain-containing protein [Roseburia sp.]MCM1462814.1 helix-turn-helix domain-containing protein [Bacteroides sp.]
MNSVELGKRIKEARLARKMTQADVVGDFITRNMLSQIESGTANPSVKTLTYLAKVLQLPVNYLLPDELETPDDSPSAEFAALIRIKNAFKRGAYADAADAAKPYLAPDSPIGDEANAVYAAANLELAKKEENPREMLALAKAAAAAADVGIFKSRTVKIAALVMIDELTESLPHTDDGE